MSKVDIKIVGTISDEEELDEIQSIAKIFIYEQRMKDFNYPIKLNNPIKKDYLKYFKKIVSTHKIKYNNLPHLMVKGLI